MMTQKDLDVIQEKIGYKFKEDCLLTQAFTRSSFAAENQNYQDNEKLEFIGDKVLDFIVVKKLTEMYGFTSTGLVESFEAVEVGEKPNKCNLVEVSNFEFMLSEGEMTEIKKQVVQTRFLSKVIEKLELEKYLIMSKGDIKNNIQNEPHVKEDLFEAIIGAIAIDSSWNIAVLEEIIEKLLNLDYHIKNGVDDGIDYISYVQNWHQKEYNEEPNYVFFNNSDEIFQCDLFLKGFNTYFDGFGYSKKEAIRLAAKRAYAFLQENQNRCNQFLDVIGDFDFESAVGKLQMLQDKKLITGLEYLYRTEAPSKESNGNPTWFCECKVSGVSAFVEYGDTKKINAKKAAAFTMLQVLTTGRDKIAEKAYDEFKIFIKGKEHGDEH